MPPKLGEAGWLVIGSDGEQCGEGTGRETGDSRWEEVEGFLECQSVTQREG